MFLTTTSVLTVDQGAPIHLLVAGLPFG
jgi:hypothetical protein